MKKLLILLPLVFFVMVSCVSEKRVLNPITPDLNPADAARLRDIDLRNDAITSYSDASGELLLTVTPLYREKGVATETDGIFLDRRVEEKSSGYRLTFNQRVKLYSYSVGFSSGKWNEVTTPACPDGVKRPLIFGIDNHYGFSADGPCPGTEDPSIKHVIIDAGLNGSSFVFNEYETCEGCFFSLDSIQVLVQ